MILAWSTPAHPSTLRAHGGVKQAQIPTLSSLHQPRAPLTDSPLVIFRLLVLSPHLPRRISDGCSNGPSTASCSKHETSYLRLLPTRSFYPQTRASQTGATCAHLALVSSPVVTAPTIAKVTANATIFREGNQRRRWNSGPSELPIPFSIAATPKIRHET